MTKKQSYTAPQAEAFVVQTESVICTSNRALIFGLIDDSGFGAGADVPITIIDDDF